jgi:hypothetical protein
VNNKSIQVHKHSVGAAAGRIESADIKNNGISPSEPITGFGLPLAAVRFLEDLGVQTAADLLNLPGQKLGDCHAEAVGWRRQVHGLRSRLSKLHPTAQAGPAALCREEGPALSSGIDLAEPVINFGLSRRARVALGELGISTLKDFDNLLDLHKLYACENVWRSTISELVGLHRRLFGVEALAERFATQGMESGAQLPRTIRRIILPDGVAPRPSLKFAALSPEDQARLLIRISEVRMSRRARHGLEKLGLRYLGEVVQQDPKAITLGGYSLGQKSVEEIEQLLGHFGFALNTSISDWLPVRANEWRKQAEPLVRRIREDEFENGLRQRVSNPCLSEQISYVLDLLCSSRTRQIVAEQEGWTASPPLSLMESARIHGYTREHIRQVKEHFEVEMARLAIPEKQVLGAVGLLEAMAPCPAEEALAALLEAGVLRERCSLEGVLRFLELAGAPQTKLHLKEYKGEEALLNVSRESVYDHRDKAFWLARRVYRERGIGSIRALGDCLQARGVKFSRQELTDVMNSFAGLRWLDPGMRWYCFDFDQLQRNVAFDRVLKIVSLERNVDSFYLRDRVWGQAFPKARPPRIGVFERFCERPGKLSVMNHRVIADAALDWRKELPQNERLLVEALLDYPQGRPLAELRRVLEEAGVSAATAWQTIQHSVLVGRIERAHYVLLRFMGFQGDNSLQAG